MRRIVREGWFGAVAAFVLPIVALLARAALVPHVGEQPLLLLFIVPIALSAVLGGVWPGVAATMISALLVEYYVVSPANTWRLTAQSFDLSLILMIVGIIISVLIEIIRRQRTRLRDAWAAAEARAAEQRRSKALFSTVFHATPVAIMVARLSDGRIVDVNSAFTELWGYTRAEALDRTSRELELWVEPEQLIQQLKDNRHSEVQSLQIRRNTGEARNVLVSVTLIQLESGAALLISAADVTEHRRARDMERLAYHDTLTNLPNRLLLQARLHEVLGRGQSSDGSAALLFIDLDGFKRVNDSFGHALGDELLRAAAARMKGGLRANDTLARFGGDEFLVLLEDLSDPADAEAIGNDIVRRMSAPFALSDGCTVQIGASVGLTSLSGELRDGEALIAEADAALYAAKDAGRSTVRTFSAGLEVAVSTSSHLRSKRPATQGLRQSC